MDPTPHQGKAAIHLRWLTVNLFLQLLEKNSRSTNNLQMCSVAVFVMCEGFCSWGLLSVLYFLTRCKLESDSKDGWVLVMDLSQPHSLHTLTLQRCLVEKLSCWSNTCKSKSLLSCVLVCISKK